MARVRSTPVHQRGQAILRELERLDESFTGFAAAHGLPFSVWHRLVHAPDEDPRAETITVAKVVRGGVPLRLVAPVLADALVEAGWRPPKASRRACDSAA